MNACAETWNTERVALALESLRRSGALRLRLLGVSMLPTLWPGDEVEIVSCSAGDLQLGVVVLAIRDGRFFVHRVISVGDGGHVITRGDAMPGPDPVFPADAVVGRVVRVSRGGRTMDALRLTLLRRAFGFLFCHSGPARRIGLRLHNLSVNATGEQTVEFISGTISRVASAEFLPVQTETQQTASL